MSDRLRFRVFYKVGKDWVNVTKNVPFILDHYGRLIKHGDFPVHPIDYPERFIVEQCTGLKDNCGNLIYEGDIIGDGEDDYVIKWDSNRTMFVAEDIDTSYEIEDVLDPTICVIGNIHEQAEQKD